MKAVPFKFKNNNLIMLDQRKLPGKEVWISCRTSEDVYRAIQNMTVRGAPAIGVAAGYGLFLGMKKFRGGRDAFFKKLAKEAAYLKSSRPTGVNLRNIVDRIVSEVKASQKIKSQDLLEVLLARARYAHREDIELCRKIGHWGSALFKSGSRILTHCNAGGLATTGYGTALGVIYACREKGKKVYVFADETRPLLQGARLTAWELVKNRIPCTVLCDNASASIMQAGKIDGIIVGADRIAANGDTANKIGTYNVAVLAKRHNIPFYVAAPGTTFDFKIKSGAGIPIEDRKKEEVTAGFGKETAPKGVRVVNPAFDVTPHSLIRAFVTEAGVLRPPFTRSFKKLKSK